MQVQRSHLEQSFSTLQKSTATKSSLDFLLQEFSKAVPKDIKFMYDDVTKNVTFVSDHSLPYDFVTKLFNFVYGRNTTTFKNPINLKTASATVSTSFGADDARCLNVSMMLIA